MKDSGKFILLWRNKWLTAEAETIDDVINIFEGTTNHFRAMRDAGVILDPESGISDDYAQFITTDKDVAEKWGFESEKEYYDECYNDECCGDCCDDGCEYCDGTCDDEYNCDETEDEDSGHTN